MDQLTTQDLALHRLKSAKERLQVAEELLAKQYYLDAASKAYYAIFQAARAALATLKMDSRKHSGVISMFNIHFVKSNIFPKEFRKIIVSAQDLRLASDYDDFYIISRDEALATIEDATRFIQGIEQYLQNK